MNNKSHPNESFAIPLPIMNAHWALLTAMRAASEDFIYNELEKIVVTYQLDEHLVPSPAICSEISSALVDIINADGDAGWFIMLPWEMAIFKAADAWADVIADDRIFYFSAVQS